MRYREIQKMAEGFVIQTAQSEEENIVHSKYSLLNCSES